MGVRRTGKFFRYNPTINNRVDIKEKAFPFRDLGMATIICKNKIYKGKGVCKTKGEAYSRYRFAFCLENSRVNGYVTEKIFDCFQEGIVPIYGGAYNIEKYVPKDCFIDYYDYRNLDEIVDYIKKN